MSSANNRNKNNKNNNNTTSSGTGKNTAMLGLPQKLNNPKENKENQNLNNKNDKNKNINHELKTTKSLPELVKETEELQVKLAKINSQMDNERYLLMQETNDLNTEITEKGFEISCLSTENKNLISQLKDIKSTMDDKIKIGKIFLEKKQRLANKEKQLNKKIEVLEKEIILAEKNNKIVENDCRRMIILAKNNEEGKEQILDEELNNLQKIKSELENTNMNLRISLKEHKLCPKIKTNLLSKLNVLNNSYEFEQKKTNMLETSMVDYEQKKEKIKKDIQEKKEYNASNKSLSFCSNIRNKVLKQAEKKNSERKLLSPTRRHIAQICKDIEADNIQNSGNIKKINPSINYSKTPKSLFTETEQMKLAAIIPPSILNEFKERFDMIENERYDLIGKLQNNKNKYNDESDNFMAKLNYTELKKKEQKMQWVDMNVNYSKKNVEINNLKNEIKKVNKEFKNWSKLLKMKNNENQKLNDYINNIKSKGSMYNSNDNSKQVKTKNKKIETDKRGSKFEQEHNIKLFYKNKKND